MLVVLHTLPPSPTPLAPAPTQVLAFFLYNFVADFILEPLAIQCYNHALERLKLDPRITVRLGEDLRAWGRDSSSRVARQQIPHQVYKDAEVRGACPVCVCLYVNAVLRLQAAQGGRVRLAGRVRVLRCMLGCGCGCCGCASGICANRWSVMQVPTSPV